MSALKEGVILMEEPSSPVFGSEPAAASSLSPEPSGSVISTPVYIPEVNAPEVQNIPVPPAPVIKTFTTDDGSDPAILAQAPPTPAPEEPKSVISTPVYIPSSPPAKEAEQSGNTVSQPTSTNIGKSAVIFSGGFAGGVIASQLVKKQQLKKQAVEIKPEPVTENKTNYLPILAGLFLLPVIIKLVKR